MDKLAKKIKTIINEGLAAKNQLREGHMAMAKATKALKDSCDHGTFFKLADSHWGMTKTVAAKYATAGNIIISDSETLPVNNLNSMAMIGAFSEDDQLAGVESGAISAKATEKDITAYKHEVNGTQPKDKKPKAPSHRLSPDEYGKLVGDQLELQMLKAQQGNAFKESVVPDYLLEIENDDDMDQLVEFLTDDDPVTAQYMPAKEAAVIIQSLMDVIQDLKDQLASWKDAPAAGGDDIEDAVIVDADWKLPTQAAFAKEVNSSKSAIKRYLTKHFPGTAWKDVTPEILSTLAGLIAGGK